MNENPKSKTQISNQAQNPNSNLKLQTPMLNDQSNPNYSNNKNKYDLGERTAKFGEEIIQFTKTLLNNPINSSLISQLVRSGTSIGANYMEADGAESKKDFKHKIAISKKEAKETMHWLRMIAKANSDKKEECRKLWKEAHELALIFSSIFKK